MKVNLLSQHQVIETIDVTKIDSVFTDDDITVVLIGGKRLYCDELSFDDFG